MKILFSALVFLFFSLPVHAADRTVLAAPVAYTATGTSAVAVAANQNRKYLLIQNNGSASVYLKPAVVHSGTEGIVLIAGGVWEPLSVPVDAIYAKSASGSQALVIQEGN